MLLLEHDAKCLLASHSIPVPDGVLVGKNAPTPTPSVALPWMVKAQVPVGGRGKAGAIKKVTVAADLSPSLNEVMGLRVRGQDVNECLVEQAITAAHEHYVSFSIDPTGAGVTIILSSEGGVEIEDLPPEKLAVGHVALSQGALKTEITRLAATLQTDIRETIKDAAEKLAEVFLSSDLTLLEINPLLSQADGSWVAADAKIIFDESALSRQPFMENRLTTRKDAYPADAFKRAEGFDFIILDPLGEVGLITTGAGLTMQVVDELAAENITAYNFCDIRSGMMRGDPTRLIRVLSDFAEESRIKAILVNIFAGITNLGEFANLLIEAAQTAKGLSVPIVTRLVGNGANKAADILNASDLPFLVENDLDAAIAKVAALSRGSGGSND